MEINTNLQFPVWAAVLSIHENLLGLTKTSMILRTSCICFISIKYLWALKYAINWHDRGFLKHWSDFSQKRVMRISTTPIMIKVIWKGIAKASITVAVYWQFITFIACGWPIFTMLMSLVVIADTCLLGQPSKKNGPCILLTQTSVPTQVHTKRKL